MYLHLGGGKSVAFTDIVGIFDLDNTTVSKHTRRFLERAQKSGKVENISEDIPRAFVVCGPAVNDKHGRTAAVAGTKIHADRIYLTQVSSKALELRTIDS